MGAALNAGAGDVLTFNGAAETNGSFAFIGGTGNDVLTGGAKADTVLLGAFGLFVTCDQAFDAPRHCRWNCRTYLKLGTIMMRMSASRDVEDGTRTLASKARGGIRGRLRRSP